MHAGYYPPALTGMRGSHDGSFDVSHALRDGRFWARAGNPVVTGESYDLVVVGGGISGLAAAYFYRARTSPNARILILDNHDDFGGHAKRNEFRPGGKLWIANGGTAGIESPFTFSTGSARSDAGDRHRSAGACGRSRQDGRPIGLSGTAERVFLRQGNLRRRSARRRHGRRAVADAAVRRPMTWQEFLAKTPLSAEAQQGIARLETEKVDYMPGLSSPEKKDRLSRMSYRDFLLNVVKVPAGAMPFYQTRTHGLYGIGIDAVGALECWAFHYPGFDGMNLDPVANGRMSFTARGDATPKPAYEFHFPGRQCHRWRACSCARSCPDVVPGTTAQDSVLAKIDYAKLDRAGSPVRIRLNSTVARVRHIGAIGAAKEVEVAYGRDQKVYAVRGKARRARVLERHDPAPVPGTAGGAEGGAEVRRQGAARLHERCPEELDGIQEARDQRRELSGDVSPGRAAGNPHRDWRLQPDAVDAGRSRFSSA